MSLAELKRRVQSSEDFLARAEATSLAAQSTVDELNAPWKAKQEALSAAWREDATLNTAVQMWDSAKEAYHQAQLGLNRARSDYQATYWNGHVPKDVAQVKAFLEARAEQLGMGRDYRSDLKLVRAPLAADHELLAAVEDYSGGTKTYLAFQGKKLDGWMVVTPSGHRGGSTWVKGLVRGVTFLRTMENRYRVVDTYGGRVEEPRWSRLTTLDGEFPQPIAQFVAALEGKLCPDGKLEPLPENCAHGQGENGATQKDGSIVWRCGICHGVTHTEKKEVA